MLDCPRLGLTLCLLAGRSRLAIIPQDPFLFSGSVRENLDPCGRHPDQRLLAAVQDCHLEQLVSRMGEGAPLQTAPQNDPTDRRIVLWWYTSVY